MTDKVKDCKVSKALKDARMFPLWLDHPSIPDPEPELQQDIRADILIVGGGFTGLWAALQAKEGNPELEVVLIEANRIAFGASGRPGGIVSTSIMHGLKNAIRQFPDDLEELERLGRENLDGFRQAIERYNIDAEVEWNGEMTVAVNDHCMAELIEEYELHRKHGHNVEYLNKENLKEQINSPVFEAGMWSHERSGTVHPAKLAWGLKSAVVSLGVSVYENTPLEKVRTGRGIIRALTPKGSVTSSRVLLATNAWTKGHRSIKRRVMTMRDHVLATEPLSGEQLARIGWKNRQGVYDNRTELNYMRLTTDNRIVFGGSVAYHFGNNIDPRTDHELSTYHRLASTFYENFPQLNDVKISHVWGGPIDYCLRYSMFFERLYRGRMIYVGGYTGFGVSGTRFGSRIALALLLGKDIPELHLDIVQKKPRIIPPEPFRWIGAMITLKVLKDVDAKGGWRRAWINFVNWLGYPI